MGWRERLQVASFRSIRFFVEGSEQSGGRRVLTHQFPLRDEYEHEDLGANPNGITVQAYVLGENYLDIRDNLITELRKQGTGVLVLPRGGRKTVRILSWRCREESSQGGICLFDIRCEEVSTPIPRSRRQISGRRSAAKAARAKVEAAAAEGFASVLSASNLGGLADEAVTSELGSLSGVLERLGVVSAAKAAASFARRLRSFADSALDLVELPLELASSVQGLVKDVTGSAASRISAFRAYVELMEFRSADRRGASQQAVNAARSGDAVEVLTRTGAVTNAAGAAVGVDWGSRTDALDALRILTDEIDALSHVVDDATYSSLRSLRAVLAAALPGTDGELPRLEHIELGEGEPALVLAHRLYGSADRADEIVARNSIQHPGFLPSSIPLEVVAGGA